MADLAFVTNSDLMAYWWQRVWQEGDEDTVNALCDPGVAGQGLGGEGFDLDGFLAFHRALHGLIRDMSVEVKMMMEQGEWVSSWVTFRGTAIKTGKPVMFDGNSYTRIVDGKVVEGHNHFDFGAIFAQLDQMPEDWMAKCMCGECVGV